MIRLLTTIALLLALGACNHLNMIEWKHSKNSSLCGSIGFGLMGGHFKYKLNGTHEKEVIFRISKDKFVVQNAKSQCYDAEMHKFPHVFVKDGENSYKFEFLENTSRDVTKWSLNKVTVWFPVSISKKSEEVELNDDEKSTEKPKTTTPKPTTTPKTTTPKPTTTPKTTTPKSTTTPKTTTPKPTTTPKTTTPKSTTTPKTTTTAKPIVKNDTIMMKVEFAFTKLAFSNDYINYTCMEEFESNNNSVKVTDLYTKVEGSASFKMVNITYQPVIFQNATGKEFVCYNYNKKEMIIPIAVGASLASLVVIVLIVYLIVRKKKAAKSYDPLVGEIED